MSALPQPRGPERWAAVNSASPLLVMHRRYERAWEEYNRVDEKQPPEPGDAVEERDELRRWYACERGKLENNREADLLRLSILYQVPSDDDELSVLAFHAWGLFDAGTELEEADKQALEQGLNSIFDYLVSEHRVDMEAAGKQFDIGAMLAFRRRRYRTGLMEDD